MNSIIKSLGLVALLAATPTSATFANPALPGGTGSVGLTPFPRFDAPMTNLGQAEKRMFYTGKALAEQPWVKAPSSTTARDGLGPLYNARTCLACHIGGGRGTLPESETQQLDHAIVRLSVPGSDSRLGVRPEPTYGEQLQTQSTALRHQLQRAMPEAMPGSAEVRPEAYLGIRWQTHTVTYPDGLELQLRRPLLNFQQLGYGALAAGTRMSLRVAPALHGLGLLEAIAPQTIEALADPQDRDGDGISGRLNPVWDFARQTQAPGRFGAKATRTDLVNFVAAAFAHDIGITNSLFPDQPCTAAEPECLASATGNDADGVELPRHLLDAVVAFTAHVAVPEARALAAPTRARGAQLFAATGCAGCHHPRFETAEFKDGKLPRSRALAGQTIWPYTDLLLHDLGPGLADHRPEFAADGREWRTAPLWGVGLAGGANGHAYLLHDGRARTVEEAIWWHGGEAESAKNQFVNLAAEQRQTLLDFIQAL